MDPFHCIIVFYFIDAETCLSVQPRVDTQTCCAPTPCSEDEPFPNRPSSALSSPWLTASPGLLPQSWHAFGLGWICLSLWGSSLGAAVSLPPATCSHTWTVCHPTLLSATQAPLSISQGWALSKSPDKRLLHVKSSGTQGRTSQGPTRPSVYAYVHWNKTMKTTNLLDDLPWPRSQCTERQGVCEAVYWGAASPGRLLSLQSRPALLVPQRARSIPLCVHSSRPPDPASSLLSSGPPGFLRHWATPLPDMLRVNPSHGHPGVRHPCWTVLLPASVPPPAPGSLPWFQVQAHLRVLSLFEAPGLLCKPSTLPSHRLYLYLLSPPGTSFSASSK